jgi:excisionase family DNA binding protein
MKNHRKRWTYGEEFSLILLRTSYRIETIAKRLERSYWAVYQKSRKLGCWPTKCEFLTSGQAAEMTGYTQQWIVKLVKQKKVKAHRVPGGKWWLIDVESLETYASDKFNSKRNRK